VVTRLETVTEPGEDKVAAAIAQIEAAGLESVSRLQETARRLDEHAAALAGVDRGLDQLAASLAVNVAQANEVSGRSAQVVDALGRLPALFDQSHEAMADWAGRCDALLARLEAEAAPVVEEKVVEEKVENRSVASRLLADLAGGA
jgi:ABC-type transporter Mla subunit MlaD